MSDPACELDCQKHGCTPICGCSCHTRPVCATCGSDDPDPDMNIRAEVDIAVGIQVAYWCHNDFHFKRRKPNGS